MSYIDSPDFALDAMDDFNWIKYLPSNRICLAFTNSFKNNKYLRQVFGDSIVSYRRDDFTTRELPALSIYEPSSGGRSRFFHLSGNIVLDIYLPITLAREQTDRVFNTLGQAIVLLMQQPTFFYQVSQFLVPLPNPTSPIYEDVKRYKETMGSPVVNLGAEYSISQPNRSNIGGLNGIGDVWKQQIRTNYQVDISNFYAMLEEFGIDFGYDPNEIIYPILENFSVDVQPQSVY